MGPKGSRCAALLLALALAGCGSTEDAPELEPADSVREAVFQGGIAQDVRCEPVAGIEVRGEQVVACSFAEEKEMSGAMRAVNECYVLDGEKLVDVTREVPPGTDCSVVSSP